MGHLLVGVECDEESVAVEPPEPAALDGGARQGSVADEVPDVPLGHGEGVGRLGDGEPLAEVGIDELTRAVLRDGVQDVAPAVHLVRQVGRRGRERRQPRHERVGGSGQGVSQLGSGEQRVGV
jgi:hypothetical protein